MKFFSSKIDNLLTNPTPTGLLLLNTFFPQVIPFNRPHKFKILKLDSTQTEIFAPLIRNNKNHLGTFHALAQGTVGELAAGMLLLRNFGMSNYRYILANLNIEYTFQAKTNIHAKCSLSEAEISNLKSQLSSQEKTLINLETILYDKNEQIVAKVKTQWQLKPWAKVKTNIQ